MQHVTYTLDAVTHRQSPQAVTGEKRRNGKGEGGRRGRGVKDRGESLSKEVVLGEGRGGGRGVKMGEQKRSTALIQQQQKETFRSSY